MTKLETNKVYWDPTVGSFYEILDINEEGVKVEDVSDGNVMTLEDVSEIEDTFDSISEDACNDPASYVREILSRISDKPECINADGLSIDYAISKVNIQEK